MKNDRVSSITLETKMTSRQLDAISSNYECVFNLESNPIVIISIPVQIFGYVVKFWLKDINIAVQDFYFIFYFLSAKCDQVTFNLTNFKSNCFCYI